uniref:F-box domain-containing protein n=1 Tax=Moniliophthora roreri TaxID=221103 RepID=A0A0W0FIC2_MONRR
MPNLSDLPLDLLPIIVSHISSWNPKYLVNLCLVNKTFYELSIAHLYQRISIYSWHKHGKAKVIQLFNCLASHPHLAQRVRRLEIRDFPKALIGDDHRNTVIQGLKNCVNLSSCTWTRDGSLDTGVLEALSNTSLIELEINGHSQGHYDPKVLLKFKTLRKISVIMPGLGVVQTLPQWVATGTLRNLTIICKSSTIITDTTLETLSPNLRNLEYLYIVGCPKVTHRGISAILLQSTNGIRGLGIEGLSPHFDTHQFHLTCTQTDALSQLRSITLTVGGIHQQASLNQWMRQVTELLHAGVPLEIFQLYSTSPTSMATTSKRFWFDIVSAHQDRLIRFSVHRMLVSLDSIEDICRRCKRLEQLFVVVEPGSLEKLAVRLKHGHRLRVVHVNYPLTSTSTSSSSDEDEETEAVAVPVLSPEEAQKIVDGCPPSIEQFGCNSRVWKVEREVIRDENEPGTVVGIKRRIARYDSPDIPEAFLVVRT